METPSAVPEATEGGVPDGASQKVDRLQSGTTARVLVISLLIHSHGHCPGGQQVRGGGPWWKGAEKKEVLIWVVFFSHFFTLLKILLFSQTSPG